jgi:hypothetical protein
MTTTQDEDADVPMQAVKGLNEATRKAMETSDVVLVQDGNLVRITPSGEVTILKSVTKRIKVPIQVKKHNQ